MIPLSRGTGVQTLGTQTTLSCQLSRLKLTQRQTLTTQLYITTKVRTCSPETKKGDRP